MATQVQLRRGTTTQNNAFTGANGELSVDTDVKTIRLHDGLTAGGGATLVNTTVAQTLLNKTFSTGSVWNGTPVPVAYGGTGAALTPVAGAVPYSTGSAMALSAAGTSGQVLVSGGSNSPVWVNASSVTAGSAITATTATNIAGGSAGQLIIQSDTDLSTFITAGASGTFLRSEGAGYAPSWATADVTIGTTVISLGSSSDTLDGVESIAITGTTESTSISTGALVVGGGVGVDGNINVGGNVVIAGNFTVNGTTTTLNSTTYEIDDTIIYIAAGNSGNVNDIGVVGHFNNGTYQHTGLVRDASDGVWKLFSGVSTEPSNSTLDFTGATYDSLKVGSMDAVGDITSPNFYSVSDERLKDNIVDSPYGLAEVMQLRSVAYDMDGRHEIGLLAQNVETHMPEFVTTDAEGKKKLDYAKMVSVLVKTVQQQQEQIEELKSRLG
jgi:hypothetical protein